MNPPLLVSSLCGTIDKGNLIAAVTPIGQTASENPSGTKIKFLDTRRALVIQRPKMALYQRAPYQTADRQKMNANESDQEEDALVGDYREQVRYDEGMEDLDRTDSYGGGGGQFQDMQAQLVNAAQPLEYQATLETKFASYDNYCNLFHYILNSDGPVDLEPPSVSLSRLSHFPGTGSCADVALQ